MGTFRMRFLMITGILFFIGSSQAQAPVNCSTGCWASRGECYWEPPTDPGLEPYWPWTCQHGEQGVDSEICYCGRCWGCKSDTAKCPNGKCSLRSPGPNFKPNGEFCNENDNCQCWEEVDQNPCKDLIDQRCKYDIGGICNPGPYLEYTEPTGTSVRALPLTNASVTRSPALMMDTVAQNMEEFAMRLDPPQTITIL